LKKEEFPENTTVLLPDTVSDTVVSSTPRHDGKRKSQI